MKEYPAYRYIAVFRDHWEIREGTESDMNRVVNESCDDGFMNEKGTTVPGVWMLYQDGLIDRDGTRPKAFVNPYSAPFSVYGTAVFMNFALVGFDDYTVAEEAALQKMSEDDRRRYYDEHPLEYRSLTDEELAQCQQLLEAEMTRKENVSVAAAVRRCPEAEKELRLKRDELFMLQRVLPDGELDPDTSLWSPFLSFAEVLAAVRDRLVTQDPALPKPRYVLEKWASKGDFNLTFFRFKDELIEAEPPDEDFHMEQTAVFCLEGDEVTEVSPKHQINI